MGNLLTSLGTAAESLRTFERALSVTSNNVSNANTPGYVRQQVSLVSQRLDLDAGLPGGVRPDGLQSARDNYLELAVRRQSQQSSGTDQRTTLLKEIEPIFDVTEGAGVAGALDAFQRAVSQWTVSPNDYPARQSVIRAAGDVANAFQTASQSLRNAGQSADTGLSASVDAVNRLGNVLQNLNAQIRTDASAQNDPGIDAQVHTALEELSQYTDFTVLRGDSGTYSIYLGRQTPFVIGDHLYPIAADQATQPPLIRDVDGRDISSQFGDGKLKAFIDFRGTFIPSVAAEVDRLASSFADQVNATLAGGIDLNGQPPTQNLFSYNSAGGAAATLSANALAPDELAGAATGAPGGNGNILELAGTLSQRNIDNLSYTQFFGQVAGRVGRAISVAEQDQQTQHQLLAQAKAVRQQQTGVSLDEEAASLIQFQRAYEATARVFQTLNELTETLINMKR